MFKKGQSGNPKGKAKGTTSKPQIRDYITPKEIKGLIDDIKASDDLKAKIWLAEQVFGKPTPSEPEPDKNVRLSFDESQFNQLIRAATARGVDDTRGTKGVS